MQNNRALCGEVPACLLARVTSLDGTALMDPRNVSANPLGGFCDTTPPSCQPDAGCGCAAGHLTQDRNALCWPAARCWRTTRAYILKFGGLACTRMIVVVMNASRKTDASGVWDMHVWDMQEPLASMQGFMAHLAVWRQRLSLEAAWAQGAGAAVLDQHQPVPVQLHGV